ncbi:peptidylprolyl isomerase [Xylophilus rhododendri]|uniref:Peptidylprolyl isomerase n=1 Tax=Xylophilus rhododendri TaxID=2697032 RepID=A0A857J3F2_9BURK|nr:peptidylprolyl isomerase [Xylophilus rhododendri]QHI97398.1 peptidylprolyl isomerase [Xylophilus rhododendri]
MNVHTNKRRNARRIAAAAALACWISSGFAQAATPSPEPVVARLGAITVGEPEVQRLLEALPPAERAAARADRSVLTGWLQQRIASEALLREARAKGWAERPEVRARVEAAVRDVTDRIVGATYLESVSALPAAYPSEAEARAAFAAAPAPRVAASYRIAQIFLAAPAQDTSAVARVRTQAEQLATQARSGDFAALARERSDERTSAGRGGDAGTLPLARMLPEVRATVAAMKPGDVAGPVQSAGGFHIVKLLETQPERPATFEELRPQLEQALRQQRQQQLARNYLAALAPASELSIDTATLDAALRQTP